MNRLEPWKHTKPFRRGTGRNSFFCPNCTVGPLFGREAAQHKLKCTRLKPMLLEQDICPHPTGTGKVIYRFRYCERCKAMIRGTAQICECGGNPLATVHERVKCDNCGKKWSRRLGATGEDV